MKRAEIVGLCRAGEIHKDRIRLRPRSHCIVEDFNIEPLLGGYDKCPLIISQN